MATIPAVIPAAAAAPISHHDAGTLLQSMTTSLLIACFDRSNGPSVQTTLPFLFSSSTR